MGERTRDGCRYSASCLDCKFKHCRYDFSPGNPLLTPEECQEILSLNGTLTMTVIAKRFGVSVRTISRIKNGEYSAISTK